MSIDQRKFLIIFFSNSQHNLVEQMSSLPGSIVLLMRDLGVILDHCLSMVSSVLQLPRGQCSPKQHQHRDSIKITGTDNITLYCSSEAAL